MEAVSHALGKPLCDYNPTCLPEQGSTKQDNLSSSCIRTVVAASLMEICCQGTLHLLTTTTESVMLKSLNVTIILKKCANMLKIMLIN